MDVGSYMTRDPHKMMRLWRRMATAVDASTLLAGAVLAALVAGHGHISAGNAWFAAIDVSFVCS